MWFETTQTKGITLPEEKLLKVQEKGSFIYCTGAEWVQPASYTVINNNSN